MENRLDYRQVVPEVRDAMASLEKTVQAGSLEPELLELVRMRASQINRCAFCLDMHAKKALAQGETIQRLVALAAWKETDFYTPRERAALAWTEAVTLVARGGIR